MSKNCMPGESSIRITGSLESSEMLMPLHEATTYILIPVALTIDSVTHPDSIEDLRNYI